MKITAIRLDRMRLPLDPPFRAAWDPVPRGRFDATLVRVQTDEGVTGYGSGDTMDGFEAFEDLFVGRDPLQVARHAAVIETIGFHAGRYWPLEAALWDIAGQVAQYRPPWIPGQDLPGEEDDDAEQPKGDQSQPDAPQDVRRQDSPWDDCERSRVRHRMDAA